MSIIELFLLRNIEEPTQDQQDAAKRVSEAYYAKHGDPVGGDAKEFVRRLQGLVMKDMLNQLKGASK